MIPPERQKIYDEIKKEYEENAKEKCYCQKHDMWYSKYFTECPNCFEDRVK